MIQDDLVKQEEFFKSIGDGIKAQRIKERVEYDMEMIKELGHCSGIENYSRYFDGRQAGERPYCLLDFFPDDFLIDAGLVEVEDPGEKTAGPHAAETPLQLNQPRARACPCSRYRCRYARRASSAYDHVDIFLDRYGTGWFCTL